MIHTVRAPKIGAKKAKKIPKKNLSTNSEEKPQTPKITKNSVHKFRGKTAKTKNYQKFPVHKFMDTRNLVDLATANNPISKQKA